MKPIFIRVLFFLGMSLFVVMSAHADNKRCSGILTEIKKSEPVISDPLRLLRRSMEALELGLLPPSDQLTLSVVPLGVSLSARHAEPGVPIEEIFSDTILAAVKAEGTYDPRRGAKFGTYAFPRMRTAARRSATKSLRRNDKERSSEYLEDVSAPTSNGISPKFVGEVLRLMPRINDRNETLVLEMTFGLNGAKELSGVEIGRHFGGWSREWVRQKKESALFKMRVLFFKKELERYLLEEYRISQKKHLLEHLYGLDGFDQVKSNELAPRLGLRLSELKEIVDAITHRLEDLSSETEWE